MNEALSIVIAGEAITERVRLASFEPELVPATKVTLYRVAIP
jgi:hypothetical protein